MKDKDANSLVLPGGEETGVSEAKRDEAELAKMGYKQELKYAIFFSEFFFSDLVLKAL
jgi:hypothetical protein